MKLEMNRYLIGETAVNKTLTFEGTPLAVLRESIDNADDFLNEEGMSESR